MVRTLVAALAVAALASSVTLAQTRPTTWDLTTLKNIGGISISPSGKYILYQVYQANPSTNRYSNQWVLGTTATGHRRTLIADGGEPILTYEDHNEDVTDYADDWASFAPVWVSDTVLYYVRKDHGRIVLHRLTLNGADISVAGIVGTITEVRQTSATRALITTLAPTPATEAASLAAKRQGVLFFGSSPVASFSPWDGVPNMRPKDISHYFELNLQNGTVHAASASTAFIPFTYKPQLRIPDVRYVENDMLSPDRRHRVFVVTFNKNREQALYISSPDGKDVSELVPRSPMTIQDLFWSSDSHSIMYLQQTNHVNQDIFSVDVATRTIRRVTAGTLYIGRCTITSNTRYAACTAESALRPPNILYIDFLTGTTKYLSDLNPNFEKLIQGMRVQTLVWKNALGDDFDAQLIYPRGYRHGIRYPLVMLTYADVGFQRGGSGDEYPILPLAARGFFVLDVNLGPSSNHDRADHKAGEISLLRYQSPLDGMEYILRQLDKEGLIEPQGVGIGGLSYGSEMAEYAVSHSKMFRAGIASGAGSWDPMIYYLKSQAWDPYYKAWGFDGPPYGANLKKWQALSAALNASQTPAALLINAPASEYIGELQHYWELRDRHKPIEMWIYPDAAHVKYQPAQRLSIYNRNIDWFAFWLQGKIDPDPAKRDQYRRWQNLRALER